MRIRNAYIFLSLAALCLFGAGIFYVKKSDKPTYPLTQWISQLKPLGSEPPVRSEKMILVHFWASWCSPCRTEMPELLESLGEWKENYQIFLVSEDEQVQPAQQFANDMSSDPTRLSFFYWDPNRFLAQQLRVTSYPETFVFSPNGTLLRKITGSMNWKANKNLDFLKSLPGK